MKLLDILPVGRKGDRPASWTSEADVPDQSGRRYVITGANSGIGLEAARILARRGAEITLACRNLTKGAAALDDLRASAPDAELRCDQLDLADLASVRSFAEQYLERHGALDVLVNNAGVMALPQRAETADGFEMQFGTNHLGHFALTGLLLEGLLAGDAPRVVTVSSNAHRVGTIDFHDLQSTASYKRWNAYGQSKLANLLFTNELDRRIERADLDLLAVAAHPGYAATNLTEAAFTSSWERRANELGNKLLAHSALDGALPTVRAATDPDAEGGDYFGPDGLIEQRGGATRVTPHPKARDIHDMQELWVQSVDLTGVDYAALG